MFIGKAIYLYEENSNHSFNFFSSMRNTLLLSLLLILFLFQINHSFASSLFYIRDRPIHDDGNQLGRIDNYSELNAQIEPSYDLMESDHRYLIPRLSWSKRDSPTSKRVKKAFLCFFNTVTCFG
ncbi:unnamed protein product [Rotaria socialis]|uniref:Uncharacterized protein n=1 Tax=Rotaria socialis TaxID=392032 RepID=A0A817PCV6_9BILA|nr:unnamed protein product [Rotaria socialis]CAF3532373.1 unnamed protein product [Rotaria socialis]